MEAIFFLLTFDEKKLPKKPVELPSLASGLIERDGW